MKIKKTVENSLRKFLITVLIIPCLFLALSPSDVLAESCSVSGSASLPLGASINVSATGFGSASNQNYSIRFINAVTASVALSSSNFIPNTTTSPFSVTIPSIAGVYSVELFAVDRNFVAAQCTTSISGNYIDVQPGNTGGGSGSGSGGSGSSGPTCSVTPSTLVTGNTVTITGSGFPVTTTLDPYGLAFKFEGTGGGFPLVGIARNITTDSSGNISVPVIVWTQGTANVIIQNGVGAVSTRIWATCTPTLTIGPGAAPPTGRIPPVLQPGKNPCTDASGNLIDCPTAIGNIPRDAPGFTKALLNVAIGLAGGIALIIMVRGAIKILMASGDPQKIQDGRDLIVAAIAGLLFLIFSVLILRFLGSDLLRLFSY